LNLRPHDGGIDDIISEEQLGLEPIYIQAKRYAPKNKIGRSGLQAFIGAIEAEEHQAGVPPLLFEGLHVD